MRMGPLPWHTSCDNGGMNEESHNPPTSRRFEMKTSRKTYRAIETLAVLTVCGGWVYWSAIYVGSLSA